MEGPRGRKFQVLRNGGFLSPKYIQQYSVQFPSSCPEARNLIYEPGKIKVGVQWDTKVLEIAEIVVSTQSAVTFPSLYPQSSQAPLY